MVLTKEFLARESYSKRINKLSILFERSFNRKIEPSFLEWRYLENPLNELLACVFLDGEQVIANYSASPCLMSIKGEIVKTALSMTTMTDPEFVGQGLFTKLANTLYEYMYQKNYNLVWGFPNNLSHRTFVQKLGWFNIYEIPTMKLILDGNKKYDLKEDDINIVIDNDFNLDYKNSQHLSGMNYVVKSKQYLKWRYTSHPTNYYTNFVIADKDIVSSYCIIKIYFNSLDIVDFQVKDIEDGSYLMRKAIKFAINYNLEAINCWAPRHHFFHSICEGYGFTNKEPITYLGARDIHSIDSAKKVSDNFSDWYIQMGDSDVY